LGDFDMSSSEFKSSAYVDDIKRRENSRDLYMYI